MAKASLISKAPISAMVKPACFSALYVAGTGPKPMISGSTPAKAKVTNFALIVKPSSNAFASLASRAAVAPSFRPDELPGVTRPAGRNGVLSPAKPSIVVCGRGGSSTVATVQPSSTFLAAVGIKSLCILPSL